MGEEKKTLLSRFIVLAQLLSSIFRLTWHASTGNATTCETDVVGAGIKWSAGVGKLFDWWANMGSKHLKRGPEREEMDAALQWPTLDEKKYVFYCH